MTNMNIGLFDNNGGTLGSDQALSGNSNANGQINVQAIIGQEYYLKVTQYSDKTGQYRISFNAMQLPSDTLSTATVLTAGTWADGTISSTSTEQWYRLKVIPYIVLVVAHIV